MHDAPAGEGEQATSVDRMREHWREFARDDAMHYVATNRREWDPEAFYEVMRGFAAEVLAAAGEVERGRMLEIGCGAGRTLIHFTDQFDEVIGVDIAPEMLETARPHMPANVRLELVGGAKLDPIETASVDLVISIQVFQHIPDPGVISSYVAEAARVLEPGGRAVLQFDTRPNPPLRRLALRLPDRLLPRDNRRYIRRYPLPPGWPAATAKAAALRVVEDRGPGTGNHLLVLERA